jgi:hypothetical protein
VFGSIIDLGGKLVGGEWGRRRQLRAAARTVRRRLRKMQKAKAAGETEMYDNEKLALGPELDKYGDAIDAQTRLPAQHERLLDALNEDILLSGDPEKLGAHLEALDDLVK